MTEEKKCPHCGRPITHVGLGGLCPECMLQAGVPTEGPVNEVGPNGTRIVESGRCLAPADIAKHFPQLEILECLGRGGMGVVYKARQPKLNRLVALKLLAPEKGTDARFAERFEREAQALARLNHPNIVTVYDFGQAQGFYYLLMEFVDGASLRQLLRAGRLAPEQALALVPQICEALQFAHGKGIVHRDIKPENVLLDKEARVKIADFGIAKIVVPEAGQQSLTQDEQVIGTPHYMAPEQVETPARVDHRADIYSLGVVFYEMLTGELPLGKFLPPSRKVQVDVRLDEVVLHALEKEPDRRYQHASEIKTDVENISEREVRKEEERHQPSGPLVERPWLFFLFGAPFLVLVAFGIRLDQPILGAVGWSGWIGCLVLFFASKRKEGDQTVSRLRANPERTAGFPLGFVLIAGLTALECSLLAMGTVLEQIGLLALAAGSSLVWGVTSALCAVRFVEKRGIRVNYALLGLLTVFKYLPKYRELTLKETGRVGPLFYSYIVAMNLALVAVALAWVVHTR